MIYRQTNPNISLTAAGPHQRITTRPGRGSGSGTMKTAFDDEDSYELTALFSAVQNIANLLS